jgi:hypothetical protein
MTYVCLVCLSSVKLGAQNRYGPCSDHGTAAPVRGDGYPPAHDTAGRMDGKGAPRHRRALRRGWRGWQRLHQRQLHQRKQRLGTAQSTTLQQTDARCASNENPGRHTGACDNRTPSPEQCRELHARGAVAVPGAAAADVARKLEGLRQHRGNNGLAERASTLGAVGVGLSRDRRKHERHGGLRRRATALPQLRWSVLRGGGRRPRPGDHPRGRELLHQRLPVVVLASGRGRRLTPLPTAPGRTQICLSSFKQRLLQDCTLWHAFPHVTHLR